MKKLFTTLAFAGAFAFGAQAQRTAEIQMRAYPPLDMTGETALTEINCSPGDTDSFLMAYGIKNNGPDALVVGDTVFIQDPEVATASNVWSFVLTEGIAVGDSVNLYVAPTTYGMTNVLYTVVDEELVSHEAPFADGEYYYLFILDRVSGTDGPVTDPNLENNVGGALVQFNDCTASILTASSNTQINVYPNPAKNTLSFAFAFEKAATVAVNIYDITGRKVMTKDFGRQNAGTQNFSLNVADLPNGNYTLELATENNKGVSKFVINK